MIILVKFECAYCKFLWTKVSATWTLCDLIGCKKFALVSHYTCNVHREQHLRQTDVSDEKEQKHLQSKHLKLNKLCGETDLHLKTDVT